MNDLNILSEIEADEMITSIRELVQEKNRFEVIAAGKIENIKEDLSRKTERLENEIQFMKDQLRAFFNTVERKSTKTQESYSLLSGKLVMKKPTVKIVHDDVKILEWAKENASEFVNQTIVNKLDWKGLKEVLDINGTEIINGATGEVLEDIGITVEQVAESFDIK